MNVAAYWQYVDEYAEYLKFYRDYHKNELPLTFNKWLEKKQAVLNEIVEAVNDTKQY